MDIITYSKTKKLENVLNYVGQDQKFPKNLNAIPYVDRTGWGMTFDVNDDNSVTCVDYPTTGNAYLWSGVYDQNKRFLLKPGKYTLSGGKSANAHVYLMFYEGQTGDTEARQRVYSYGSSATFTISTEYYCSTNICIEKNTDVDGYTFHPQIEEGGSATAYEDPFITFPSRIKIIEDLDIGKVKSKNLNTLPYYDNADHTQNSVTFKSNEDNTIELTGTASGNAYLVVSTWNKGNRPLLEPGTYTLTTGINGGYSYYGYVDFYSTQDSTTEAISTVYAYNGSATFTIDSPYYVVANFYVSSGNNVSGKTIKMQIEKGSKATEYVSPKKINKSLRLNSIEENIESLKNDLEIVLPPDLEVPFYYHAGNYLNGKCDRLNALAKECDGLSDTFAFVTDMHWTLNAGRSPSLLKYIKENTRIDKLFCGGDVCDIVSSEKQPFDAFTHYLDAWKAPIYTAIGNHEYLTQYGTDGRAYYIFNSIGRDRIGNLERNYFYIENTQAKIRYVFLSAFKRGTDASAAVGYEADQLTWLSEVALDVETGWGIVVITHWTHGLSGTTPVISSDALPMLNILDSYSGNGEIIAVVSGHTHFDFTDATTGGIPIFVTTCDKCDPWISGSTNMEPWLGDRVRGTKTEQVIDLFIIDRESKNISRVRVGCPIHYGVDPETWTDYEDETVSYNRT